MLIRDRCNLSQHWMDSFSSNNKVLGVWAAAFRIQPWLV